MYVHVFFFQAEDGIRDGHVTGVQTCALPILKGQTVASFCRKTQNSPSNQAFVQIFSDFCIFPLTCICVLWHIYLHDNSLGGVLCRGLELVSDLSQKPRSRYDGCSTLLSHASDYIA